MNTKRTIGLVLAVWALVAFVVPVTASASDGADDPSVYFRPAVRFGSDDRTLYIFDFLIPVYRGNKDLLFINTKFTPDDHTAWETNLGIGYRRLVLDDKLVLGGNLFYDHRKTAYGSHFDQLGLGFEAMAEPGGIGLATRFNYYQPLTKAKLGDDFGYVFYGNGIYTAGIEEPMTGFDYEAGIRIPGISNYVETWAYAGGYHFFGCHVPDVNGVSARIEAMPTDFLRLNFEYRNDTVNHDQYYGEVALEVPFSIDNLIAGKNPFEGIGDVLTGSRTLKERMTEPVHRDVDVVVGRDYLSGPDAASDGNLVAGVIFVADNADDYPGTPDGSFEHPYGTLELAESNLDDTISIIHVLTGDGSGLSGYIFDTPGLTIWGAGAINPCYPYVTNFAQGYPLINSALYLGGADMTVLGLDLNTSDDAAISVGGNAFESGLSIFANRIYNNGLYGIWFVGDDGIGTAASPVSIWGNTISVDGGSIATGIYLFSYDSDGGIYSRIFNNLLDGIYADGYASGIELHSSGDIHASIIGNTINDINAGGGGNADVVGIYLAATTEFFGSISGNTITGLSAEGGDEASATGIYAITGNDFLGSITGNRIRGFYSVSSDDDAEAVGIDARAGNDFLGSISGNTIEEIETGEGDYLYTSGIDARADRDFIGSIFGNTITDVWSEDEGPGHDTVTFGIDAGAGRDFLGSIYENTITGIWAEYADRNAEAYGVYSYAGGDFIGSIFNNTISDVWAEDADEDVYTYGIYGYASGDFTGSISNNTVTGIWAEDAYEDAWASGIYGGAGDYFSGSISKNRISNVNADYTDDDAVALGIEAEAGNNFNGSIFGNTVSDVNAWDTNDELFAVGIGLNFYDWYYDDPTGSFSGTISGNTISGVNSYDGYDYWESDGIMVYADYLSGSITGNRISEIFSDGGYASGISALCFNDFSGSISDNTIRNISGYGVSGWFYPDGIWFAVDSGDFTGSITGNTITGVTSSGYMADGIEGFIDDGYFIGTISGNTVTGVSAPDYANGLHLDVEEDILGSITDNVFSATAGISAAGIYLRLDDGAIGTLSSPLIITGNSGHLTAAAAYAMYLNPDDPEDSNVWIGSGTNGMGDNDFVSSSIWSGNYPDVTGAIWAEGYPTYHYIHP